MTGNSRVLKGGQGIGRQVISPLCCLRAALSCTEIENMKTVVELNEAEFTLPPLHQAGR
jgi:hypothetical protein